LVEEGVRRLATSPVRSSQKFLIRKDAHCTLSPYVFYLRAVGRAYPPTFDVASTILYEGNKEATRGCTEAKTETMLSKKKPAGSSRERIGPVGGKLSPVATGVGRGRYWSSRSTRSSLATNV
jgi:hypothetical protein